jgi:hypothetical protein
MLRDLGGLDEATIDLVRPLVIEAAWTEQRLADARRLIGTSDIVVPYDNGGGQEGVRRNPAYDGYNALAKTYVAYLKQLETMTGAQVSGDDEATSPLARQRRDSPLAR